MVDGAASNKQCYLEGMSRIPSSSIWSMSACGCYIEAYSAAGMTERPIFVAARRPAFFPDLEILFVPLCGIFVPSAEFYSNEVRGWCWWKLGVSAQSRPLRTTSVSANT